MRGSNLVPSRRTARPLGLALAATLAIALLAIALAGAESKNAHAEACSGALEIDFAGLPAGTILGEQYASSGVHISGEAHNNGPDALIVFDSNSTDTDLDADLRVGIGNIAIFADNLTDVDPADGLVDRPDENNFGGRAIFRFDRDVSIGSFIFVDKDHTPDDSAIAYDAGGNVIAQVAISPAGNGSVQTINVNADGVRRFEVLYGDSGGFTGIEVDCGQEIPTPTPVPETPTPTAVAETPTPAPVTPTPTSAPETPTTAPTASAEATPTVAAAAITPSAAHPVAVAAEVSAPQPGSAVAGAQALPSGGAQPDGRASGLLSWTTVLAALTALSIAGGSAFAYYRTKR